MFVLTEEQRLAVDSFRRYAEKELRPLADKYEKDGGAPDAATVGARRGRGEEPQLPL